MIKPFSFFKTKLRIIKPWIWSHVDTALKTWMNLVKKELSILLFLLFGFTNSQAQWVSLIKEDLKNFKRALVVVDLPFGSYQHFQYRPQRMQDLFDFYLFSRNYKVLDMLNVKYIIDINQSNELELKTNENILGS